MAINPESVSFRGTAEAAVSGDLEALEKALAEGAGVNDRDGESGLTPLHRAALANRVEAMRLLIEQGARTRMPGRATGDSPARRGLRGA
ncbi:MAG: ankyrin repeat domain-containing protein [Isosphaeraceae bacterium]